MSIPDISSLHLLILPVLQESLLNTYQYSLFNHNTIMDLEQHLESQIFQSLVAFNFDHRHHHNIRSSSLNGCIDSCSLRMTSFHTILRIDIIKFSIRFNNQQTLYTDIFPSVSLYILFGEHWQSFLVAIHIPLKFQ